jgi:type 1 glutamine amidotransferase
MKNSEAACRRRSVTLALALCWLGLTTITTSAAAPLKICLLSASAEYESEKSLSEFQKYLESKYNIVCQRAFGKDKGDGLPGLDAIATADLMVVFTRRVKLPPAQFEQLQKYIGSGKPIIGLRTASHAFDNYMDFDREVLGGGYKGHYTNSQVQVEIVPAQKQHPVLAGVTPFTSRKLYKNPTHADNDTILLEGAIPDHKEPLAWVREHNGGRVFYTSLGVQEDFVKESFRRLLVNAIFWTTGRDEAGSRR